jgi:hypothetical protein
MVITILAKKTATTPVMTFKEIMINKHTAQAPKLATILPELTTID